ncbi:hypothetical protein FS837_003379, partial [Tulasnella sp. UAMH 9824]
MDRPPNSQAAARGHDINDLLPHVKGLFRLIDADASSGASSSPGTITISQKSLGDFINAVAPGAYINTERIDFGRLNRESRLRLIGIYGNKSEIVRFFETCGAINSQVAKLLLVRPNASPTAQLRPGIYVFDPLKPPTTRTNITSTTPVRYVIYWPQEPVWNRFSGSSKARDERVNCMRYLTCLTDQIRCLISPDHESALGLEAMQGHSLIDNGYNILREALVSNLTVPQDIIEMFSQHLCSGEATQAVVTFHLLSATVPDDPFTEDPVSPSRGRPGSSVRNSTTPDIGLRLWVLEFSVRAGKRLELTPVGRTQIFPLEHRIYSSWRIRLVQMLTSERCLLIVDTPEKSIIWLFSRDVSFRHDRPTYEISSLWDQECAVAVDEQTRVIALVIMGSGSRAIHLYQTDNRFSVITARRLPCNLLQWYDDKVPQITHAAFFAGSGDLCLVELSGRIRVFSVSHQRIRPGTVYLEGNPLFVRSCPRNDVLLLLEGDEASPRELHIFHRSSFDTRPTGTVLPIPSTFLGATSFSILDCREPGSVFLLGLKPESQELVSTVVDVGKEKTNRVPRARIGGGGSGIEPISDIVRATSPLINCFSEVWERFPVVSAIQRETIAPETRQNPSVTFVCQQPNGAFRSCFNEMIKIFEESFQKPTGQRLSSIQVLSSTFDDLDWKAPLASTYRAGEWVAELLCLVPIQLAVMSNNRFVLLKDGILERPLEGDHLVADVTRIIDSLSLGWYEPILGQYMANKPVRSLQACRHILDPASNPSLFKGLLAVIIKDVMETNKQEIVKEFSSNFGQLISSERSTSFVTELHDSQMTVVPWSIIQSREFYTLFAKLKGVLFNRKVTHGTAGEFLITLKALMAKMKAQDWEPLDQAVIKHRVFKLSSLLPAALEAGRSASTPDSGVLT